MKLLMIPFEDHFNNLINILKLTFISIIITSTIVYGSDQLNDYTIDSTQTCKNVEIILTNDIKQGVLNPLPTTKCKWIINAPINHQIDLTLIGFIQSENCLNKLEIKSETQQNQTDTNNLWIQLDNNTKLELANELNSCNFNLKQFTKIESNQSKLIIEYESIDSNQFTILFNANEITQNLDLDLCNNLNDELRCSTEYNFKEHVTCLPKNLLCNCDLFTSQNSTKCEHLNQNFNDTNLKEAENCFYFLKLNNMCQNQQILQKLIGDDSALQPADFMAASSDELDSYETVLSNQIKLLKNERKSIEIQCLNQTLSNEYGWISSPNFLQSKKPYPSNLNCLYHVSLQPNQIVQLRFKYFNLASNSIDVTSDNSISIQKVNKRSSFRPLMPDMDDPAIFLSNRQVKANSRIQIDNKNQIPFGLGRSFDYDYLNIYDGSTTEAPLLAHLTSVNNDFTRNFNGKVFNSKSNNLLIVFHTAAKIKKTTEQMGFNLTYQIKGLCIEDQTPCNSLYELNCYSKNQTCNDAWDCHNGADERGCGPCKPDQFRCRNHIFCYRLEDRCDGDHQCIDKSDELNCDPWFCNSDNGTFLCNNGRCVYEQWVCDGANDCDDGSDEINCPTPFTRRVITTAVLGGTLCCLLLVMALGCACKLYSLHTVGYRNNIRLSQSVQSAAAHAASVPLIPASTPMPTTTPTPTVASLPSNSPSIAVNSADTNTSTGTILYNNLATLFRRALTNSANNSTAINLETPNVTTTSCDTPTVPVSALTSQPGELPTPHYLIAPPTYNQTMGLVDEYEQRQLAFIEHVRSILLAQQNQPSSGLINLNPNNSSNLAIPTVTSSSTILHRVTSSGRRSHSSRHHRHHHNRSSSNTTDSAGVNQLVSTNTEGRVSHSRRHHHHHHHHRHRTHCSNLTNSGINSGQISNSLSQVNFDSNRRGLVLHQEPSNASISSTASSIINSSRTLQQQLQRRRSSGISSGITSSIGLPVNFNSTPQTDQLQMLPTGQASNIISSEASSSASNTNQSSSFNTMVNKSQSNSINLRDRIAKLIKDIVVHHGDNIQYVQLADQINSNSNSVNNSNIIVETNPTNQTTNTTNAQLSTSSNLSQTGSEDDVPLIQP